ncbi:DUF948 domain-containing protein [Paenibacillus thermoaerophilus]|uniref:DUF948 domain-containing protein n=1 Tax=Paenibacillus thermoaerophilus TaxID=1215385 RepID=A0ABW2VAE3_9BACL|nr:DUF948 domain-containing protein [Paenibacillus thermoaerophilus]TMV17927.1 DUF948 domain-containing protein [Paenibacillus thermoaerophilus]
MWETWAQALLAGSAALAAAGVTAGIWFAAIRIGTAADRIGALASELEAAAAQAGRTLTETESVVRDVRAKLETLESAVQAAGQLGQAARACADAAVRLSERFEPDSGRNPRRGADPIRTRRGRKAAPRAEHPDGNRETEQAETDRTRQGFELGEWLDWSVELLTLCRRIPARRGAGDSRPSPDKADE